MVSVATNLAGVCSAVKGLEFAAHDCLRFRDGLALGRFSGRFGRVACSTPVSTLPR